MNPIAAALAELPSAHLSESGSLSKQHACPLFGSPRRHLARTKLTFTACLPSTKPSPSSFSAPRPPQSPHKSNGIQFKTHNVVRLSSFPCIRSAPARTSERPASICPPERFGYKAIDYRGDSASSSFHGDFPPGIGCRRQLHGLGVRVACTSGSIYQYAHGVICASPPHGSPVPGANQASVFSKIR